MKLIKTLKAISRSFFVFDRDVAQWFRAFRLHRKGREFDSHHPYKSAPMAEWILHWSSKPASVKTL